MATIITRAAKGTPLTHNEVDANFVNLNTDKLEASTTATLTNKTINLTSNTLVATSAQLRTAVTDETGTGSLVFGTAPTITGGTINATTLQEGSVAAVVQTDIGTASNEIPLNQYLGNLAYQDSSSIAGNMVVAGSITAGSFTNVQETLVSGTNIKTVNGASLLGSGDVSIAEYNGFRNRIINGDMRIDQRNAGVSVTPASAQYLVDRFGYAATQTSKFSAQQNAGGVTPPVGFAKYLGLTSLSAYSVLSGDTFLIRQFIEGFNTADFAWGTANAQSTTLSFWVRSSLTGTFGGALANGAANRSYPFSYTVSLANTWEQKVITIPGDTAGTWADGNTTGVDVRFGLGSGSTFSGTAGAWAAGNIVQPSGSVSVVGTSGATFYTTGIQLEAGSVATPFERRPYGTELTLCQRYYYKIFPEAINSNFAGSGICASTTVGSGMVGMFPVTMRVAPTSLEQSGTASHYLLNIPGITSVTLNAVPTFNSRTNNSIYTLNGTVASGLTLGYPVFLQTNNVAGYLAWSAEL